MGSRGRFIFDLNELPTVEEEESDELLHVQPSKLQSSATLANADMLISSQGCNRIVNNYAFSHASSVSGFQPFVRPKEANNSMDNVIVKEDESNSRPDLSSMRISNSEENKVSKSEKFGRRDAQPKETEEGEWSYMEASNEGIASDNVDTTNKTEVAEKGKTSESSSQDEGLLVSVIGEIVDTNKNEGSQASSVLVPEQVNGNSKSPDADVKGDGVADNLEETSFFPKLREVKGIEASHALKCANNPGKRNKIDQLKEAMLGKKRNRQTMFLNLEDVKQAGPLKTSTPKRQSFSSSLNTRTVKEMRTVSAPSERVGEKQGPPMTKDQKQMDGFNTEGSGSLELSDHKSESNGDVNQGPRFKKLNGSNDSSTDCPPIPRHNSWKQPADPRQMRNHQGSSRKPSLVNQNKESADLKSGNKKHLPSKKLNSNSLQYQDTSVERLLREVTNEKFWHHPEETELQCVPGKFESVEEYARVFEPLLFEECRAQLYSTWEEFTETVSKDAHIMVRIKYVEKRERE